MNIAPQFRDVRRRAQEYAKNHSTSGLIGKTGRLSYNIPAEAYHNAIQQNGPDVVNDKEYWRDQARLHPEIAVKFQGAVIARSSGTSNKPRNRFGRIKTRIRMVDGKLVEEHF